MVAYRDKVSLHRTRIMRVGERAQSRVKHFLLLKAEFPTNFRRDSALPIKKVVDHLSKKRERQIKTSLSRHSSL